MADVAQLNRALRAAHEAGDTEAARRLAAAIIREQQAAPAAEMTPEQQEARLRELVPGVSIDPTEGMSGFERFAAGMGQSVYQTGRGIGQLTGILSQEEIDAAAAQDAPLMNTGAGLAGNIVGNVAQVVIPAGGAARTGGVVGRVGGAVLNPRTVATAGTRAGRAAQAMGVGGAVGGAQAALQPVVTGDTRLGNIATGAALGAAGQGLFDAGAAGVGALRRVLQNSSANADTLAAQGLRQAIGPEGEAALAAGAGREIVPGSQPTTAEALRAAGQTGPALQAAMLERGARVNPDFIPDFRQLDETRNAARVANIRGEFGGADAASREVIETARDRAAAPLRRRFERDTGVNTPRVIGLIDRIEQQAANRPAVANAMQQVRQSMLGVDGEPLTDVASLYQARLALTDTMAGLNPNAPGAQAAMRQLVTVKSALDNEMRRVSPAYGQYLRQFRERSRDASRVAVGERLLASGRQRASSDSAVELTSDAFQQATRDLDRTVQQATGFRRARADTTITPQQRQAIEALRRDLDSQAWVASQSRASPNSITAESQALASRTASGVANLITEGVPFGNIAKAVFADVSEAQQRRVAEIMASALRNPERARQILASVPANQRGRATALVEAVRGTSLTPAAGLGASSIGVGVGQPEPLELEVRGLPQNRESAIRARGQ